MAILKTGGGSGCGSVAGIGDVSKPTLDVAFSAEPNALNASIIGRKLPPSSDSGYCSVYPFLPTGALVGEVVVDIVSASAIFQ